jgi:aconitate hydratase
MFLGVVAVIAKSMARIHRNNLINHGVAPLIFEDTSDYDTLSLGDCLSVDNLVSQAKSGRVTVKNLTIGKSFTTRLELSPAELEIILSGGLLPHIKQSLT